jgi:hypothetical protein
MKGSYITFLVVTAGLLSGCTYEGMRMQERRDCGAMPQSQADRCFARTAMTKEEYDVEREKVKRTTDRDSNRKSEDLDPRYEKWIP